MLPFTLSILQLDSIQCTCSIVLVPLGQIALFSVYEYHTDLGLLNRS